MAAATKACESTPVVALYGPKSFYLMNGYINRRYKSRSIQAVPPKELRTQEATLSPIVNGSAAVDVRSAVAPRGISANGVSEVNNVDSLCKINQTVPDPSSSTSRKRRKKKFRHKKKRDHEVVSPGCSDSSLTPEQEKEDWEKEIQEVTPNNWEKMHFGLRPYGPEDLLQFSLRDLNLAKWPALDLPLSTIYRPSVHHPQPVNWFRYSPPTEPDQFSDAIEYTLIAAISDNRWTVMGTNVSLSLKNGGGRSQ